MTKKAVTRDTIKPERIPEFPLVLTAFFLNFFWEMIQSPWYADTSQIPYQEMLIRRIHCTLGDVLILLFSFWIVGWMVRDRQWIMDFRLRHVTGFTLIGLAYTVFSEWLNVDIRSAWGYGPAMPRIPVIGTGVAPIIQWLVLPPVIARVTRRFGGK